MIADRRSTRMQNIDRPADIQPFPQPTGAPRPCVDPRSSHLVRCLECPDRITSDGGEFRHVLQRATIRSPEVERAVGLPCDLVSLFVDGSMMASAEQYQVRQL